MTKSWEGIKDEACRLYLSGKTLSEVQKHLEANFDFKASKRSYRLHFSKWGITRATQLKEFREGTVSSERSAGEPVENDTQERTHAFDGSERAHSLPPESVLAEVPIDSLRHTFQDLHTGPFAGKVGRTSVVRSRNRLESVYDELRSATEPQRNQILETESFVKGAKDNILHYAAARDDPWTLNCILDYMSRGDISIDLLNSRRYTALEIAIQSGKAIVVKILLDADASLTRRNEQGLQPLHFAISERASTEICHHIMESGADVNSSVPRPGAVAMSPMYMTLEMFLAAKNDQEKNWLCSILQELIDHGAQINLSSTGGETPLMKFVKASAQLNSTSVSVRQEQTRPSSLLGYYLSADQNPLCWFPKQHCPALECKSLAAFIFAHTPKSGLSALLIESSNMAKYGLDLVHVLLNPCRMRYSSVDDPTINELLLKLMQQLEKQGVSGYVQPGLLSQIVNQTPKKKRLECLEILLNSGYVDENECREALTWLDDIDESGFRLSFAELLLAQFTTTLHDAYVNIANELFSQKSSRFQDFTNDPRLHERIREQVFTRLVVSSRRESEERIVQCVVHVFTKFVLEGRMNRDVAPAGVIIYVASRLRERYDLPDIPVAKRLLLELRYIASSQNKLLRNVQDSETSDFADSPETFTMDSPSYPTPDSTRSPARSRNS